MYQLNAELVFTAISWFAMAIFLSAWILLLAYGTRAVLRGLFARSWNDANITQPRFQHEKVQIPRALNTLSSSDSEFTFS